jgi:hypothetical protein
MNWSKIFKSGRNFAINFVKRGERVKINGKNWLNWSNVEKKRLLES